MADRSLLEALPPDVVQGGYLPVAFALTTAAEPGDAPTYRTGPSDPYHARVFICLPSPKPITRCFEPER